MILRIHRSSRRCFYFLLVLKNDRYDCVMSKIFILSYSTPFGSILQQQQLFYSNYCMHVYWSLLRIIIIIFNQVQKPSWSLPVKPLIVKHMINACGFSTHTHNVKVHPKKFNFIWNIQHFDKSFKCTISVCVCVCKCLSLQTILPYMYTDI